MSKPKDQDWESWIDQQIREAQEKGAFDDLPGKGRPLDLPSNPYAKEQELAFKVLKDAGFAPEWIELDKAIRTKLQRARTALERSWNWRGSRFQELAGRHGSRAEAERARQEAGWRQAVTLFEEQVAGINRDIADLNLKVPSPRFQRSRIDAAREIERVQGKT